MGEYLGWAGEYLASSAVQFFYDPRDGHPWDTGEVPTWIYNLNDDPTRTPLFPDRPLERLKAPREDREGTAEGVVPSGELAIPIIEGLACGVRHELAAVNVPNRAYVPGLPDRAVVEVPAVVDQQEVRPRAMERLPEGILGLLRTQASINELLVEAYDRGSRDILLQALLLDPTTRSLSAGVRLVDRMFELQGDVLPQLSWERSG